MGKSTFTPFVPTEPKEESEKPLTEESLDAQTIKQMDNIFNFLIRNTKTFNLNSAFSVTRNLGIDYAILKKHWDIFTDTQLAAKAIRAVPGLDFEVQLYESNLI